MKTSHSHNEHAKMTSAPSIWAGMGLAILGTTCCALPITMVALGMGGAVVALASNLPWLVTLSKYKAITFSVTAMVLIFNYWRLYRSQQCSLTDGRRIRKVKIILGISATLLVVSVFAAYVLLPITLWIENA